MTGAELTRLEDATRARGLHLSTVLAPRPVLTTDTDLTAALVRAVLDPSARTAGDPPGPPPAGAAEGEAAGEPAPSAASGGVA